MKVVLEVIEAVGKFKNVEILEERNGYVLAYAPKQDEYITWARKGSEFFWGHYYSVFFDKEAYETARKDFLERSK